MTTPPVSQEAGALDRPFDPNARDAARMTQQGQPGEPVQTQAQPFSASPAAMAAFGFPAPPAPQQNPATPPMQPQDPSQKLDPLAAFNPSQQRAPDPSQVLPQPQPLTPQQQANQNGQAVIDGYSPLIQQAAEQAYALAEFNALNKEGFLEQMVASGDKLQRELAAKVLERNAEKFNGAKTIEEYQAALELDKAGDDPVKRELAEMKLNQIKLQQESDEQKWRNYKEKKAKIEEGSDFDKICDSVRKEYPKASFGDVIHIARGRAGIDPTKFGPQVETHGNAAPAGDRGGQSPEGEQLSGQHQEMFGIKPGVQQSAERYFGSMPARGIRR